MIQNTTTHRGKSLGVRISQRAIIYVRVRVDATSKPDRITLNIAANLRRVVSGYVVEGSRFVVRVLPFESQPEVEDDTGAVRIPARNRIPEWFLVIPSPNKILLAVVNSSRCVQMIGVDVVD